MFAPPPAGWYLYGIMYHLGPAQAVVETGTVLEVETMLAVLLCIATLVALLARYLKIAYTVALVLVGLGMSFITVLNVEVSEGFILGVLIPPLVFQATMHLSWQRLRVDLGRILSLSVGGTILTTFLVGVLVRTFVDIPWQAALAFGALIASTDPVSVIDRFRELGVNKRLSTLVEGESLFNNGTGIVLFSLTVAGSASLTFSNTVGRFLLVFIGGSAVGAVLGYLTVTLILKFLDNYLLETIITLALALGSYVLASNLGLDGISSVIMAGLIVGNLGRKNTSPTTRYALENFWEMSAYVINAFVFLLMGVRMDISLMLSHIPQILVAVVSLIVVRMLIVYGMMGVNNLMPIVNKVPLSFQHILYWGGLKGAVNLALALSLPFYFSAYDTEILMSMTFGSVLFTLLVQGTTIKRAIDWAKIPGTSPVLIDYMRFQGRFLAARAGRMELEKLSGEEVITPETWQVMDNLYDEELTEDRRSMIKHFHANPRLEIDTLLKAREDMLRAGRSEMADAVLRGLVSEEIAQELVIEISERLAALEYIGDRIRAQYKQAAEEAERGADEKEGS